MTMRRNTTWKGYMSPSKRASGGELTRQKVYRILAKNKAISQLARDLGKNRVHVMNVLRGATVSAAVLEAATERAREFLREAA